MDEKSWTYCLKSSPGIPWENTGILPESKVTYHSLPSTTPLKYIFQDTHSSIGVDVEGTVEARIYAREDAELGQSGRDDSADGSNTIADVCVCLCVNA